MEQRYRIGINICRTTIRNKLTQAVALCGITRGKFLT
jgi:hypothetical protein